jgi:hypothetical protein
MLIFPKSTTGTALFALDSTLILAAWPFVLRGGRQDASDLFTLPGDPSGYIYPVFDLILLFAMGLYRRDAILEVARSFTRVPMVVGMGASLSARASIVLPLLARTIAAARAAATIADRGCRPASVGLGVDAWAGKQRPAGRGHPAASSVTRGNRCSAA